MILALQHSRGTYKKGNAAAFLNVPLCGCIVKIVFNFEHWLTFENQMLTFRGVGDLFFGNGEKRAEQCRSKMDAHKVGVSSKYVPYTYNFFLTVVLTIAPPSASIECRSSTIDSCFQERRMEHQSIEQQWQMEHNL